MSRESQLLEEVELRIAMFGRKYNQVNEELADAMAKIDLLTDQSNKQREEIQTLEQKLSVATIATGSSPEANHALLGLREELDGIVEVIDECITLLEKRIE
ncbi:hypothetical protein QYZ87_06510 [Porphyromonadaceae bacterium W3.11]|nr:hypothetical protein [Porphyromonadaceae bacterium W3.11]